MKAYLSAIGVGITIGGMCLGLGIIIGRLSADTAARTESLIEAAPRSVATPTKVELRKDEPPHEEPLSEAEKKLIRAIATAPPKEGGRAWPPIDPQQVGSVGFIIRGVKVNQVVDELSFLGTMQWRIVAKDVDGHATYQASDDPRYLAWFLGVDTRELFDGKVLAPYPPKKRELIFEDGWESVRPLRYKTAIGGSRTVISMLRFDATRVRELTDGKGPAEMAELIKSLGD
jgi:hypothetical protein